MHSGPVRLPHPRLGKEFDSPVRPGSGWPGDPATANTAVAATPAQVAAEASSVKTLAQLDALVSVCRGCPRLVEWREQVAAGKRKSFADQPYWGRPIPGWGAAKPKVMILGLAPAAHGGNRTGRVFTGDRSGDVLYAALFRAGLSSSPDSVDAADGTTLIHTRMAAAVRCAPPANAPTPAERQTCGPWLDAEWRLIESHVRVIVALGAFAWRAALNMVGTTESPQPRFGHGTRVALPGELALVGCYHPSQQNTFTGKLTPAMVDDIFAKAKSEAGIQ